MAYDANTKVLAAFTGDHNPDASPLDQFTRNVGGFLVERGIPLPLGPNLTVRGVNFAVFSRHATAMRLVLFAADQGPPVAEIDLDPELNRTGDVWHIRVRSDNPSCYRTLRYVWKADGPRDPAKGYYYDISHSLLDPYAKALSGGGTWGKPDIPHEGEKGAPPISPRRCRIAASHHYDWEGDKPLDIPIEKTVIYELHVRGFTIHGTSGVAKPGTFIGLTEKIPYLKELGITAVELMPVFEFDENENLRRHPRTGEPLLNYWGYSPIGFFCPNAAFAHESGDAGAVIEFKDMVRAFHGAGIEVLLDVVFNHTAEGDERGPTISFRGLDNPVYYMLDKQGKYRNYSGCGNTVNCNHPLVRAYILDVLRYWAGFMHVDGFRFDLASILGRDMDGNALDNPPVLEIIAMDPVLANTKLIAEAWDAGGLNQVGRFPSYGRWAEWNGFYRDDIRMFWRGDRGMVSRAASRVCGSDDLYLESGRRPGHSINFITAHDGFTMNDLVSYGEKHNGDNGERNLDGENYNNSTNFGVEGPTDDQGILQRRRRQMKNFFATLLLSQGTPMLLAGDEFARTQRGNNNAYCQDNEISWVDWSLLDRNRDLARFVRLMIAFRKAHPVLARSRFFAQGGGIGWHGERENEPDWSDEAKWLAFLLDGGHARRDDGSRDDDLYIMMNASGDWRHFAVPDRPRPWRRVIDTAKNPPDDVFENASDAPDVGHRHDRYAVEPGSVAVLVSGGA
ncbi:MAG: glycogen debranching protein GlgX [Planctomycetota bacterium]|jgi:glycogen operon protein|nr:glycogen debranching protein GlgX [Planctomycetota bacterium]